jgi:long-chain acyl-CoA synthetase
MLSIQTMSEYLSQHAEEIPGREWLRERAGDGFATWTWAQGRAEVDAAAAWLEDRYGASGTRMAILSRNRAHWVLADQAIIDSGNVTIPLFTTLPQDTARYILEFSETKVLFLGETANWPQVVPVLPEGIEIITLPGVECDLPHRTWADIVAAGSGQAPTFRAGLDDIVSLVFTSGTTGKPKGSIQTHRSFVAPMERFRDLTSVPDTPELFSYLPLSHIAERQLVMVQSLLHRGRITFNESLETLLRDVGEARPHFFFGAPRVWEQLQQAVFATFGSRAAVDEALAKDRAGTVARVKKMLGMDRAAYMLTAAAPTPPALIHWYNQFDLPLMEGYGQTEAMGVAGNQLNATRVGSIGKPGPGVEVRIGDDDELLVRAEGLSLGYYNDPDKTAELIDDEGWLHTGDKARIDEDGYIFLTGRVKDYFKTIQGKFVAPVPIESEFASNDDVEQVCLLGRGMSKTVMVCVLAAGAAEADPADIESSLIGQARAINDHVEKHARIGAIVISREPWTIENAVLTPTLKIRRDEVEKRFGELAADTARKAAEQGELLAVWA